MSALGAVSLVLGVIVAWLLTLPLFRFKELRPLTPKDVANEAGVVIKAKYSHSVCPRCHHHHTFVDVIPVVSWIKGCPQCGLPVPKLLPIFQAALPAALVITTLFLSNAWVAIPFLWFAVVVASISVVDARIWLIPWWIPWVGSAVGVVLITISSIALDQVSAIPIALASGAVTGGLFFVIWFIAPRSLGFGDVRLAVMIGLFLGWIDPALILYGLLIGSLLATGIGVVSWMRGSGTRFAFGPPLSAGSLLAVWLNSSLLG